MTKAFAPESLIGLAMRSLRRDVLQALPPDQQTACAEAIRLLEIAQRQITDPGDEALWRLLDRIYDDGEGSAAELARDIRSGKVTDKTTPGLRDALKKAMIAELKVRHPAFLHSRGVKT
jgi:Domain of unknown function (DUF6285)